MTLSVEKRREEIGVSINQSEDSWVGESLTLMEGFLGCRLRTHEKSLGASCWCNRDFLW